MVKKTLSFPTHHGLKGGSVMRSSAHSLIDLSFPQLVVAAGLLCAAFFISASTARAASPADLLSGYAAQAGSTPAPARGQQLFNSRHGREWACASCHGAAPVQGGRHAVTGRPIAALAPAFNPERFTDPAKTEKWFRRNCNDVIGRECTASEKADVLSWLLTLKP